MEPSRLQKLFMRLYLSGPVCAFRLIKHNKALFISVYFCLLVTLVSNWFKSREKTNSKFHFVSESFMNSLVHLCTIFELYILTNETNQLASLGKYLLEPLRDFPLDTPEHRVTRRYTKNQAVFGVLTTVTVVLSFLSMSFLVTFWHVEDNEYIEKLPYGNVILPNTSTWIDVPCYLMAIIALLSSIVIYVTWYGIFVCSALLAALKLKLLAMRARQIGERARQRYGVRYTRRTTRQRVTWDVSLDVVPGDAWAAGDVEEATASTRDEVAKDAEEYLTEILEGYIVVAEQTKLLDETYRWIMLVTLKVLVIIVSLNVIVVIEDLDSVSAHHVGVLNMLFGLLSYLFTSSYCGQIVSDEINDLFSELYCLNWTEQPLSFQKKLLTLLTMLRNAPVLTAGNLFKLNLETFRRILKGLISYLSFLIAMKYYN